MIGILDFIYFPYLNKYIKRHINSFIELKHHLLDDVHQSLTSFYSSSYLNLVLKNYTKYGYQLVYGKILEYHPHSYMHINTVPIFQKVKEIILQLMSFLFYNKKHPLHRYLIRLWNSKCLIEYTDRLIDNTIKLTLHKLKQLYIEEYDTSSLLTISNTCCDII